ncbi:uncharacterized protein MONBRDRAFT_44298 [Monosiga brevicollis MX1]|uniref:Protein kinase domain-containing protein n=1 Tax=Monosiga brevicollis TaxID=81824 RepID=A9UWK2_MONBE|nr:uncharacterized protein MONBRDRAFT_44298 [Monosiga brevicollis MX1]EDQ90228.1 predicted protein [Monosiga brevicollis MX1]|eukprot:XP_001744995.1 hypothetical protein [Monosiga brevicollis MX1]
MSADVQNRQSSLLGQRPKAKHISHPQFSHQGMILEQLQAPNVQAIIHTRHACRKSVCVSKKIIFRDSFPFTTLTCNGKTVELWTATVKNGDVCEVPVDTPLVFWTRFECRLDDTFQLDMTGQMTQAYLDAGCQLLGSSMAQLELDCTRPVPLDKQLVTLPNGGSPYNLVGIRVRGHRIKVLTYANVYGLADLQTLDLSHNNLTALSDFALDNAYALENLNLSHNQLGHINRANLPSFGRLKVLDVSNNPIRLLDSSAFDAAFPRDCAMRSVELDLLLPSDETCQWSLQHGCYGPVVFSGDPNACTVFNRTISIPCEHDRTQTFMSYQLCDGHVDCDDASDEFMCDRYNVDMSSIYVLGACTGDSIDIHHIRGRIAVMPSNLAIVASGCVIAFHRALAFSTYNPELNATAEQIEIVWSTKFAELTGLITLNLAHFITFALVGTGGDYYQPMYIYPWAHELLETSGVDYATHYAKVLAMDETQVYEVESMSTLAQRLGQTTLTNTDAIMICGQIASACSFLESLGVVHRNLGAHSVLCAPDLSRVFLGNFCKLGTVLQVLGIGVMYMRLINSQCEASSTNVTKRFWSAEVWSDQIFSTKSDVYAYGQLCWQVYNKGQLPYPGMSLQSIALHVQQGTPPSVRAIPSEHARRLILQCLRIKPESRPNFATLAAAWASAIEGDESGVAEFAGADFDTRIMQHLMTLREGGSTRQVAVKLLLEAQHHKEYVAEVTMLSKMHHPNLMGLVHTTVTAEGHPGMVLEYMPQGSLEGWLQARGTRVSHEDLLLIAHQVAMGMNELARLGIVHRDLAARNVLIGRCLNVKVADFGLSRVMQLGRDDSDAYYRIKTRQPMPLRWMAPESILSRKCDVRSDVWSYGCLCVEMWSGGELPYARLKDAEVLERLVAASQGHLKDGAVVLASPSRCPAGISDLIQSCLCINPELRLGFTLLVQRTRPEGWHRLISGAFQANAIFALVQDDAVLLDHYIFAFFALFLTSELKTLLLRFSMDCGVASRGTANDIHSSVYHCLFRYKAVHTHSLSLSLDSYGNYGNDNFIDFMRDEVMSFLIANILCFVHLTVTMALSGLEATESVSDDFFVLFPSPDEVCADTPSAPNATVPGLNDGQSKKTRRRAKSRSRAKRDSSDIDSREKAQRWLDWEARNKRRWRRERRRSKNDRARLREAMEVIKQQSVAQAEMMKQQSVAYAEMMKEVLAESMSIELKATMSGKQDRVRTVSICSNDVLDTDMDSLSLTLIVLRNPNQRLLDMNALGAKCLRNKRRFHSEKDEWAISSHVHQHFLSLSLLASALSLSLLASALSLSNSLNSLKLSQTLSNSLKLSLTSLSLSLSLMGETRPSTFPQVGVNQFRFSKRLPHVTGGLGPSSQLPESRMGKGKAVVTPLLAAVLFGLWHHAASDCPIRLLGFRDHLIPVEFGPLKTDCGRYWEDSVPVGTVCSFDKSYRYMFWTHFRCIEDSTFVLDEAGNMTSRFEQAGCTIRGSFDDEPELICRGVPGQENMLDRLADGGAPSNLVGIEATHHNISYVAHHNVHGYAKLRYLNLAHNTLMLDLTNNPVTKMDISIFDACFPRDCRQRPAYILKLPQSETCQWTLQNRCYGPIEVQGATNSSCRILNANRAPAPCLNDRSVTFETHQFCDGYRHCADGSDEFMCEPPAIYTEAALIGACVNNYLKFFFLRGRAIMRAANLDAVAGTCVNSHYRQLQVSGFDPMVNVSKDYVRLVWNIQIEEAVDVLAHLTVDLERYVHVMLGEFDLGDDIIIYANQTQQTTRVGNTLTTAPLPEGIPSRSHRDDILPIVGAVVGTMIVIGAIVAVFAFRNRRRRIDGSAIEMKPISSLLVKGRDIFCSLYNKAARDDANQFARMELLGAVEVMQWKISDQLNHGHFSHATCTLQHDRQSRHAIWIGNQQILQPGAWEAALDLVVEAHLLNCLHQHRHILNFAGYSTMKDGFILIYDMSNYTQLADVLRLDAPNPKESALICQRVAEACSFLDSLGIVHRNLGAHSVFCVGDITEVRLANITTARDVYLSQEYVARTIVNEATMASATAMGSSDTHDEFSKQLAKRFWSAEVWSDQIFSTKSDVYAYGQLCWQVYNKGQLPYPGMSLQSIALHVQQGTPPSVRAIPSEHARRLILQCLRIKPESRPNFALVPVAGLEALRVYTKLDDQDPIKLQEVERCSLDRLDAVMARTRHIFHEHLQMPVAHTRVGNQASILAPFASTSLTDYLQLHANMDLDTALGLCRNALEAVEYLASRRVLLEDLRVGDFRVTRHGVLKLDYGRQWGLTGLGASAEDNASRRSDSVSTGGGGGGGGGGGALDEVVTVKAAGRFLVDLCELVAALRDQSELRQLGEVMRRGRVKKCGDGLLALLSLDRQRRLELPYEQLTFVRALGQGEFGQVSLMTLREGGSTRQVAVKLLLEAQHHKEYVAEVTMLSKMHHPNLMGLVHTTVTAEGHPGMVLEYMPQGSLEGWLQARGTRVSHEDLLLIAHQVAMGMNELARLGIVHRDLAARNVLIGRCLNVKVADFGLSRVMQLGRDDSDAYYRIKTRQPMPLRWMAPESILSRKCDVRSDVWSYGCLCVEMWSGGELPYARLKDAEVLERLVAALQGHLKDGAVVLASPSRCPAGISDLIQSCLCINPELRLGFALLVQRTRPEAWVPLIHGSGTVFQRSGSLSESRI